MRIFNMIVAATVKSFASGCDTNYDNTRIYALIAPAGNTGTVSWGNLAQQPIVMSAAGERIDFPCGLVVNLNEFGYIGTASDELIVICE